MEDSAAETEPIRSKYRGLSWDKKYAGWRVRMYYAGKQRHVGRYEEEIAAAKAYDKAVVCLYGENAITNFGLKACLEDPAQVSVFILQAKEKAEQDQQARVQQQQLHQWQQRPFSSGSTTSSPHLQAVLQHGMMPSPQLGAYQQQLQQQQPVQQQSPLSVLSMDEALLQQQLLSSGSMAFTNDSLQQQLASSSGLAASQPCKVSGADSSSCVVMPSPLAHNLSDVSFATSTTSSLSNTGSLSSINTPPSSSASSYMLCSILSGQTVVLPVMQAAPPASGCATQDSCFAFPAQSQVQQQQQRLQPMQVQQQPLQPQPQFAVLQLDQPLQLSVHPELTAVAGDMSAAAQLPGMEQQQQLMQQFKGLTVLESASSPPPGVFCVSTMNASNTPQPPTALQQYMQLQAQQLLANGVFPSTGFALLPNSSMGPAPNPAVPDSAAMSGGSMSWGFQQHMASPAALAGGVSTAISHEQQQLSMLLANQGSRSTAAGFDVSRTRTPLTVTSINC